MTFKETYHVDFLAIRSSKVIKQALAYILLLCFQSTLFGQVVVNEFQASNSSTLADEDGEFSDWVELYNAGPTDINILGWSLTDDSSDPGKWFFPSTTIAAGDYLVLFASGKDRNSAGSELHTSFSLKASGEYLGLYDQGGQVQFEFAPDYGIQVTDVSYGLSGTSASLPGGFLPSPTPGSVNGTADPSAIAQKVDFSQEAGKFENAFSLTLSSPDNISIRYTLDGSQPTSTIGELYTGPLMISSTTVLQALAFGSGFQDSEITTASYFFLDDVPSQIGVPNAYPSTWSTEVADYDMDPDIANAPQYSLRLVNGLKDLPIVSIIMDKDSLFGAARGIYQNTEERGFDWERATHIELISETGELEFSERAGIRIQGGASRLPIRSPKHNFRVAFRSEYGPSKLESDIYQSSPGGEDATDEFDTFVLKAGYNFTWIHFTHLQRRNAEYARDSWMSDSQLAMGSAATHVRNVHLFLNGLYWGLYKIVERPDASWAASYFGGSKDDYDALNSGSAINGDSLAWEGLLDLVELDMSNSSNYNTVIEKLDITDFTNYMILNQYGGNTDWDHHNWYGSRNRNDGPYRFTAWDSEHSLKSTDVNVLAKDNADSPTHIFQRLLGNSDFLTFFADQVYGHLYNGGALSPDSSIVRYQRRTDKIDRAIIAESARWGDYRRDQPYTRDDDWAAEVDSILTVFFPQRREVLIEQYRDAGLYPTLNPPELSNGGSSYNRFEGSVSTGFQLTIDNASNGNAGAIIYTTDGSDPRASGGGNQGSNGGDSVDLPISGVVRVNARILQNGQWSALQTGLFVAPQMLDKLVINEIHYNPLPEGTPGLPDYVDGDEFEFIELKNTSGNEIQLHGTQLTDGIEYQFPPGSSIASGDYFVLAENAIEFENRYGFAPDGQYSEKLSNGGERIVLVDISGVVVDSLTYGDSGNWPDAPDDGVSLSLDPNAGTANDGPDNWQISIDLGGTPGAVNVNALPEMNLTLKVLLSGAWEGNEMRTNLNAAGLIPTSQPYPDVPAKEVDQSILDNNPDIVDWVWVELRTGTAAASSVSKEAFLINKVGELLDTDGNLTLGMSGLTSGDYYVVVGHRNHLPIMSAGTQSLAFAQAISLDFTADLNLAYTTSSAAMDDLGNGLFGLWSGDASSDRTVKYTGSNNDRVLVLDTTGGPTPFDTVSGYFNQDINLDGVVKYSGANNDRVEILEAAGGPTAFEFRSSQVPQ